MRSVTSIQTEISASVKGIPICGPRKFHWAGAAPHPGAVRTRRRGGQGAIQGNQRIWGASEGVRDARVSPIVASPAAVSKSLRKTDRKFTEATSSRNIQVRLVREQSRTIRSTRMRARSARGAERER